jgi:hypothetical protein
MPWINGLMLSLLNSGASRSCMLSGYITVLLAQDGLNPLSLFLPMRTHLFRQVISKFFGSPVYVLDKALQDGSIGAGKWKDRCYQGAYVGHSQNHASNVILVYNPKTHLGSPKYHIVHDESFDTVWIQMSDANAEAQLGTMLDKLFTTSAWRHSDSYSNSDLPEASHHYFDSSWDLAFALAQANSQRKHESNTRKRAHDSLSNPEISQSKGVHSTSPVQVPTARACSRSRGSSDLRHCIGRRQFNFGPAGYHHAVVQ